MLTNDQLNMLHQEQEYGIKATRAYEEFLKPLFDEKRALLFNTLSELNVSDIDGLQEVKRHLTVIDSLDTNIHEIIQTGKMASQQLAQEPLEKH